MIQLVVIRNLRIIGVMARPSVPKLCKFNMKFVKSDGFEGQQFARVTLLIFYKKLGSVLGSKGFSICHPNVGTFVLTVS